MKFAVIDLPDSIPEYHNRTGWRSCLGIEQISIASELTISGGSVSNGVMGMLIKLKSWIITGVRDG
jgi:hypothetical protein